MGGNHVVFPIAARLAQSRHVADTHAGNVPQLNGDLAAADIDVGIADGADHLRQGDVVGVELVEIDFDFVFFGGPAPGVDLDHAFDGQEPSLHDPILHGAQIAQSEVRRPYNLIPVDFANQAGPWIWGKTLLGKETFCCRLMFAWVTAK